MAGTVLIVIASLLGAGSCVLIAWSIWTKSKAGEQPLPPMQQPMPGELPPQTHPAAESRTQMLSDTDLTVVDIRDVRERQRSGWIPGSVHAPRGMLEFWVDPESPYFKPIFGEERRFVLHCASGWRSALATATLNDMGFPAAHLAEGFSGWQAAGGPVAV